jgi:hypothetical protein
MIRDRGTTVNWRSLGAWLTTPRQLHFTSETWTWLAVGLGVVLRVVDFATFRALYKDERSLLDNLVSLSVFDFHTTLTEYQLAPPGFLVLERLMVRLPGNDVWQARAAPLLCGIAAIFLFRWTARRYLTRQAVPIAVGLFALCDWLIYYSTEIKQYSSDLGLTLIALLLAAGPVPESPSSQSSPSSGARLTTRRLWTMAGFGLVGVWFSYPLALVLAGVGTYLLAVAARRKDWRQCLALAAIGMAWLLSFGACYEISHRILDKGQFIWDWWDFAFLPIPPRSLADLDRDFWQILNAFDSPANVRTPLGVIASAFLALGLFLLGAYSLWRRWPGGLYLLVSPIGFSLVASVLHQYPFHGRLLIFLVPSIHLLVGEGVVTLTRRGAPWSTFALAAFLFFQPCSDAFWLRFVARSAQQHTGYDSHGDLRHDLLDYLETRRIKHRLED